MQIIELHGYLRGFSYDNDSKLTVAQQQALSMGAVLSWSNHYPVNTLEVPQTPLLENRDRMRESFYRWWVIMNHDEAIERLDDLIDDRGHKSIWPEVLAGLKSNTETFETIDRNFVYKLNESIPALIKQGVIEKEEDFYQANIDAWDYGRVVYVARTSYLLGYISEEQAWFYIMKAFEKVKQTYRTWLDFAKSYLIGRFMWGGLDREEKGLNLVHAKMFEWDDSIWNRHPLNERDTAEQIQATKRFVRKMYAYNLDWSEKLLRHWVVYLALAALMLWMGVSDFMHVSAYERGEVIKLHLSGSEFFYKHAGKYGVLALPLLLASLFLWGAWFKKVKKIWRIPLQ